MVTQLVKQLYSRDSRHKFCPENHWLSPRASISIEKVNVSEYLQEQEGEEGGDHTMSSGMIFMSHIKEIKVLVKGTFFSWIIDKNSQKNGKKFTWKSENSAKTSFACESLPHNTLFWCPPNSIPIKVSSRLSFSMWSNNLWRYLGGVTSSGGATRMSTISARNLAILKYIPFAVPFLHRVEIFQKIGELMLFLISLIWEKGACRGIGKDSQKFRSNPILLIPLGENSPWLVELRRCGSKFKPSERGHWARLGPSTATLVCFWWVGGWGTCNPLW